MEILQALQNEISSWSEENFPNSTIESLTSHLIEEAQDLHKDAFNAMNLADILILLLVIAKKGEYNTHELLQAAFTKHQINKSRIWQEPDSRGITRHKK